MRKWSKSVTISTFQGQADDGIDIREVGKVAVVKVWTIILSEEPYHASK